LSSRPIRPSAKKADAVVASFALSFRRSSITITIMPESEPRLAGPAGPSPSPQRAAVRLAADVPAARRGRAPAAASSATSAPLSSAISAIRPPAPFPTNGGGQCACDALHVEAAPYGGANFRGKESWNWEVLDDYPLRPCSPAHLRECCPKFYVEGGERSSPPVSRSKYSSVDSARHSSYTAGTQSARLLSPSLANLRIVFCSARIHSVRSSEAFGLGPNILNVSAHLTPTRWRTVRAYAA
ncbi:hypothetical protein FB451DRAFT_1476832, partial [Mycena latifolia]